MTDSAGLLRALAVPRLVGTPHHTQVRDRLKRELAARGFAAEEHAFTARPSRLLFGAPQLVRGINLIARRPESASPPVWLAAHYDSKGQPISMATRIVGAGCAALGVAGVGVALLTGWAGWSGWTLIPGLALATLGGAILSRNRVTDRSPGAVDNASALVAVFAILDALPQHANVGVLFLDAEEFGLLGARALVEGGGGATAPRCSRAPQSSISTDSTIVAGRSPSCTGAGLSRKRWRPSWGRSGRAGCRCWWMGSRSRGAPASA